MKKVIALTIIILMISTIVSSTGNTTELKAIVAPFKIIVDGEIGRAHV